MNANLTPHTHGNTARAVDFGRLAAMYVNATSLSTDLAARIAANAARTAATLAILLLEV